MKAIERLENILDERDRRVEELEEELENIKGRDSWRWAVHQVRKKDADPAGLPVPRLELRIIPLDQRWYGREIWYGLVGDIVTVPMGVTTVHGGGGKPKLETDVRSWPHNLPFRDGAHVLSDMQQLGLPAYLVCEEKAVEIVPGESR